LFLLDFFTYDEVIAGSIFFPQPTSDALHAEAEEKKKKRRYLFLPMTHISSSTIPANRKIHYLAKTSSTGRYKIGGVDLPEQVLSDNRCSRDRAIVSPPAERREKGRMKASDNIHAWIPVEKCMESTVRYGMIRILH